MYVCICNALTERDIAAAAVTIVDPRPADLFEACRCRAQCGTCVRRILAMIRPDQAADAGAGATLPQPA